MRKDIHPAYHEVKVSCSCGHRFSVHSTLEQDSLHIELCSRCHPVYTGQRQASTHLSGRADRFNRKYGAVVMREEAKERT